MWKLWYTMKCAAAITVTAMRYSIVIISNDDSDSCTKLQLGFLFPTSTTKYYFIIKFFAHCFHELYFVGCECHCELWTWQTGCKRTPSILLGEAGDKFKWKYCNFIYIISALHAIVCMHAFCSLNCTMSQQIPYTTQWIRTAYVLLSIPFCVSLNVFANLYAYYIQKFRLRKRWKF